ncbi:MAG: 4-hydroxy-tetrahydrodipicolinate synthase [Myxococcota bacterium]|jgi:4-hydroxy-tetrahydrodipicolinate synthase
MGVELGRDATLLTGTLTALYTPFGEDGGVEWPAYTALCERMVDAGSGLVPCGTTGETPALTPEEYLRAITVAARVAGDRVPVVAGTGTSATRTTIELTKLALQAGADAALVVVPPYNKPPQCSLIAHFTAVAEHGGLPIVLYNVPGRTGTNMTAATTLALARNPRFIAIKEAAGDLGQLASLVNGAPTGFTVLSGDDAMTLPLLALGGHGVVSVASNVVPKAVVAMVRRGLAGDIPAAREYHHALTPLFEALFAVSNPIPLKRAAALLGHGRADVRLPLTADALDDAAAQRLAKALEHALSLA